MKSQASPLSGQHCREAVGEKNTTSEQVVYQYFPRALSLIINPTSRVYRCECHKP